MSSHPIIDRAFLDRMTGKRLLIENRLAEASASGKSHLLRELMAEHNRLEKLEGLCRSYLRTVEGLAEAELLMEDPESDDDVLAMAREEMDLLSAGLPSLEKKLMIALLPPDPAEARDIVMEIRAGTGGDEAALFAGDLFRMYSRYAEPRGWTVEVLDANPSSVGGFKEIICSVEGEQVFRRMKFESGVHRVQRIPATEASGRIHTSAATVAVLPDAEEVDDIDVKPEDLRIDVYRSSGAGGQHVNTTDSAVRITHLPSGVVAQSQDERSQHRNREKAMRVLKARLLDRQRTEEEAKAADARRSQIGSGDRSERIRTYNFPQNRVTDHRIGVTLYSLDRMMEGDLDPLLDALYDADVEKRLADRELTV